MRWIWRFVVINSSSSFLTVEFLANLNEWILETPGGLEKVWAPKNQPGSQNWFPELYYTESSVSNYIEGLQWVLGMFILPSLKLTAKALENRLGPKRKFNFKIYFLKIQKIWHFLERSPSENFWLYSVHGAVWGCHCSRLIRTKYLRCRKQKWTLFGIEGALPSGGLLRWIDEGNSYLFGSKVAPFYESEHSIAAFAT